MNPEEPKYDSLEKNEHRSYRLRLPRLIGDEDIGTGDIIKRMT